MAAGSDVNSLNYRLPAWRIGNCGSAGVWFGLDWGFPFERSGGAVAFAVAGWTRLFFFSPVSESLYSASSSSLQPNIIFL